MKNELNSIYIEAGYKSRGHYLSCLAEETGVGLDVVLTLANLYGPSEDFDGLVSALDDVASSAWG